MRRRPTAAAPLIQSKEVLDAETSGLAEQRGLSGRVCTLATGLTVICCLTLVQIVLLIVWIQMGATTQGGSIPQLEIINEFARAITEREPATAEALFESDAVVDFGELMQFLTTPLSISEWIQQLEVFFGIIDSGYMTLANCNVSSPASRTVICLGYHAYTYDAKLDPLAKPSTFSAGFTILFEFSETSYASSAPRISTALVLSKVAPTNTKASRVAPQNATTWYLLNAQISALVAAGELQQASVACNTTLYIALKSIYDPFNLDLSVSCNNLTQETRQTTPLTCSGEGRVDNSCIGNLTLNELVVDHLTVNNFVNMTNNETGVLNAEALRVAGELTCAAGFSLAPGCPVISSVSGATPTPYNRIDIIADAGIVVTPQTNSVIISNTGVLRADLQAPGELFVTNSTYDGTGRVVLRMDLAAQPANTVWAGPVVAPDSSPSFRPLVPDDIPAIDLAGPTRVVGVLPVTSGGTGNLGIYTGNRLIRTSPGGSMLEETEELPNGHVLIGVTGQAPAHALPVGAGGISITPGVGTLEIKMTQSPSFSTLTVSGTTILGAETTCQTPMNSSCVDISRHTCPSGPLLGSCIPTTGLHLHELVVDFLTITNATTQLDTTVLNGTNLAVDMFTAEDIHVMKTLTCDVYGAIGAECVDISSKMCHLGPLDESCMPLVRNAINLTVTQTLSVNNVECLGNALPGACVSIDAKQCAVPVSDSCVPSRIKSINGILSDSITQDFSITAGPYVSLTTGPASLIISGQAPPLCVQSINAATPNSTTGAFTLKSGPGTIITQSGSNELTISSTQVPATTCCNNTVTLLANQIVVNPNGGFKLGESDSSTFGWRDYLSEVAIRGAGSADPVWTLFRGGIYGYAFSATALRETHHRFHIDHDYALGTEIYPHVHFSPGNVASTGDVRWCFEYTIARGHGQAAFSSPNTTCLVHNVPAGSQYKHFVAEVSDSNAISGSLYNIEPDTLILIRVYRDGAHVTDTFPDVVYGWMVDLHVRVHTLSTKNKAPNFYN